MYQMTRNEWLGLVGSMGSALVQIGPLTGYVVGVELIGDRQYRLTMRLPHWAGLLRPAVEVRG